MMTDRVTRSGKQIMLDGHHLADARDEIAAEVITTYLNEAVLILPEEEVQRKVEEFFNG